MPQLPRLRRRTSTPQVTVAGSVLKDAIATARIPSHINQLPRARQEVVRPIAEAIIKATDEAAKAAMPAGAFGSGGTGGMSVQLGSGRSPRRTGPINAAQVAQTAIANLSPSSSLTPAAIEAALHEQGLSWVEPFAPGRPLTPYYGYTRRARQIDYPVGRNITTEPRDSRIPFTVLRKIWDGYDVAQICTRHIINDLRSMRLRFSLLPGEEKDTAALEAGKAFLRKPDGKTPWGDWLARWGMDVYRYDAGCVYKQRNKGGKVIALKVIDGTTIAPMLDYFGDVPQGDAPAYVQFVQGIPWDWIRAADMIYQPLWPLPESPYGLAPIESVLINANTDVRLQWYFLNFFTEGMVPEAFATAPPDQSDPDSIVELQETFDAWTRGNQAMRYGLRFLPSDTKITPYKPQQFTPEVAEYVMKRTVAAYGLVPQDLGFTKDVNRSTGDTQMDVQFRVNTLPNVGHFEALLDDVLQSDLTLPVEVKFDTGREKEDRLMEAQAHQIYVSIGAESPDEVRDSVLALPVDPEAPVPRMFDSQRLGPVPLSYVIATSGQVDVETKAPLPGSVPAQQFVIPGAMQPDPSAPPAPAVDDVRTRDASTPAERRSMHQQTGVHSGRGHDTQVAPSGGPPGSGRPADVPGYGTSQLDQRVASDQSLNAAEAQRNAANRAKARANAAKGMSADLKRWRDNSRSRVAKGLGPKRFGDSSLPESVIDAVWRELEGASTRSAVDAVFARFDASKATETFDPKGQRPGPGGFREAELVAYWTPVVASWLGMGLTPDDVAQRFAAMNPPTGSGVAGGPAPKLPGEGDPLTVFAQSYAASLEVDDRHALASLRAMRSAGYLAGAKDGADQLAEAGREVSDQDIARALMTVDWDNWNPGHVPGAARLEGEGLRAMLDEARLDIKGISDTTRDRIAAVLAQGVRNGDTWRDISARLNEVLHDPKRADMIARTEINRAMTRASVDMYGRDGLAEFDLVTEATACPICLGIAADNPHPLSDLSAQPPIHPNCRCAASPVVEA